ncbi:uncharacterized protein LOC114301379 [Camellia sinensis]|uniref:uncharacterized protein LOC114301379 n=1 Tax=Camellia sinensis TaxID=4442 RepID=UPI0010365B62|nr:uncharacterized protein LOC114301379 [Camellia sinensis]
MIVTKVSKAGERNKDHGCSMEGKDHLIQSTKKIKTNVDLEDEAMGEKCGDGENSGAEQRETNRTKDASKSFKQALLQSRFNENGNEKNFDHDVDELSSNKVATDMMKLTKNEDGEIEEEIEEERDGILRVKIPTNLLKKIREPWRKCLIVRLLGKTIGYKLFIAKMTEIWELEANFEARNGFFIVKFDLIDDYMKVFTGGPWIVMDHYVIARKWQQDFKLNEAEGDATTIWVRFPTLPSEHYNEKALFHIAKVLGTPLKIDINIAMAAWGKYARVCVEMDLQKPLVS